jgi:DNA invertase Pin-like site-specific DNA recombinase
MSTEKQNPRSPEQQFTTIEEIRQRAGFRNWGHVNDYRDDGVSGRFLHKRPGFQRMLTDIKLGRVSVDLILVDTMERLGRADELLGIRRELQNRHGVLVLTADTSFADPTGAVGRVHSAFENLRATEEGRIKAHNVLRGKKDAVRRKRWPGGEAPLGLRNETRIEIVNGQSRPYSVIVPDPATEWIIRLLFNTAHETGWGQMRLARFLNEHPDVPKKFKPFQPPTVGRQLKNELYTGVMLFPQTSRDVIDDVNVSVRVSFDQQERIKNYCDPIIATELFEKVSQMRRQRAAARRAVRNTSEKHIKPVVAGLSLKYPLTGLVRCGICDRAMVPNGSVAYKRKDGTKQRYVCYFCPGRGAGLCTNDIRVSEEWLRATVIRTLKERLFPHAAGHDGLDARE